VFLAFVGVRTIDGARDSANDAARARVREILQEDRIQKLARDEAADLFKNGAYAHLVNDEGGAATAEAVEAEVSSRVPTLVNAEVRAVSLHLSLRRCRAEFRHWSMANWGRTSFCIESFALS